MSVRSGSSAVELGEETLVWSKYSAATITKTFLASKTDPQRLYRGPLGPLSQILLHGRVLPAVVIMTVVAVMAIVTVLVIETGMAPSRIFRTRTRYQIQGLRSRVAKSSSHQNGGRRDCH